MLTEESFVDFKCPHCGESTSFPQESKGLVRECPSCMECFIVPEEGSHTGGKLPLPVTAPRLVLRRLAPGDWKDLLEIMPDAGEEFVLRWLEQDAHVRLTTPEQAFYLGIELQEGNKVIGFLRLTFTDAERLQAAMEITLNEKFKQKELALEAADAFLGFCFEGIGLHRVIAQCDSQDANDCGLYEELGMRREAEFVKDKRGDGEWRNTVWYAALEEEYRK